MDFQCRITEVMKYLMNKRMTTEGATRLCFTRTSNTTRTLRRYMDQVLRH